MGLSEQMNGPRLVDAHVHIRREEGFSSAVRAGVAAVRDAGIRENSVPETAVPASPAAGIAVISSRWALYKKPGYGSLFGIAVENREDIPRQIVKLKAAGAGIIKVMASGMVSLQDPGTVTAGGFDREMLALIVQEAEIAGLAVMAHANGEQAVISAAEAGVRSIEHGFFMTQRALDSMAKRGTFWVPTTGALHRAAIAGNASQSTMDFVNRLIGEQVNMLAYAHAHQVPLAVGTDCVLPDAGYREAYEAELAYFEQAGLSRDEVMRIACESGAKLLGI